MSRLAARGTHGSGSRVRAYGGSGVKVKGQGTRTRPAGGRGNASTGVHVHRAPRAMPRALYTEIPEGWKGSPAQSLEPENTAEFSHLPLPSYNLNKTKQKTTLDKSKTKNNPKTQFDNSTGT